MVAAVIILTLLPSFISCTGDGNIRILEDEIANSLRICTDSPNEGLRNHRRQRSNENQHEPPSHIDTVRQETNLYGHEKRNMNDARDQIRILNVTDYESNATGTAGEKLFTSVTQDEMNDSIFNRTKRNEPLLNKGDTDQCLSQCVFANLQVVDSRGIPREAELWNKVQASVTSQQSRSALRDQIRACFQELQSEAEDNGCSYSNKLERCLMLRFTDRKINKNNQKTEPI